jgi:hypothetical protein
MHRESPAMRAAGARYREAAARAARNWWLGIATGQDYVPTLRPSWSLPR